MLHFCRLDLSFLKYLNRNTFYKFLFLCTHLYQQVYVKITDGLTKQSFRTQKDTLFTIRYFLFFNFCLPQIVEFPRTLSPEFWVDLTLGTDSSLGQPLSLYQVKKALDHMRRWLPWATVTGKEGSSARLVRAVSFGCYFYCIRFTRLSTIGTDNSIGQLLLLYQVKEQQARDTDQGICIR